MTNRICSVLLGAVLSLSATAEAARVYVYLPAGTKARRIQASLEAALPGHEVTAFGRARDFASALKETPPDAVIAMRPVLENYGLPVHVQGYRSGQAEEMYLLLAPEGTSTDSITDKVVGTIDLMGRSGTERYVSVLIGTGGVSLKRVTGTADLLPLLQFEAADMILLPERSVQEITAVTEMTLLPVGLDGARVGLAAISFPNGDAALQSDLTALAPSVNALLGVDAWKPQ